jgi:hypothetical protein
MDLNVEGGKPIRLRGPVTTVKHAEALARLTTVPQVHIF